MCIRDRYKSGLARGTACHQEQPCRRCRADTGFMDFGQTDHRYIHLSIRNSCDRVGGKRNTHCFIGVPFQRFQSFYVKFFHGSGQCVLIITGWGYERIDISCHRDFYVASSMGCDRHLAYSTYSGNHNDSHRILSFKKIPTISCFSIFLARIISLNSSAL